MHDDDLSAVIPFYPPPVAGLGLERLIVAAWIVAAAIVTAGALIAAAILTV